MAEAIPEAAEVAGEAGVPGVSEAAAGAPGETRADAKRRARFASSYRGAPGETRPYTGGPQYSPGAAGEMRPRKPRKSPGGRVPLPPSTGQQGGRRLKRGAARAGRSALTSRLPGSHSYQPVILAEFVVAALVVSVSPLATGGTATAQAKGSASPYDVNTLKQLIAIGMVYFVLALFGASEKAGRYAAWFGGLVLVGLGLTQLASGDLQKFFHLFVPAVDLTDSGSTTGGTGSNAAPGPGPSGAPINPSVIDSGITPTQPNVGSGSAADAASNPNLTQ